MPHNLMFLGGVGAGAGLILLFDPAEGRRRRMAVRDRVDRALRAASEAVGTTSRDLRHRLSGAAARLGLADVAVASDGVLCERVRARLKHVVSYPRAIQVAAAKGRVVLTGAIPRGERHAAIAAVARVAGVESVDDCLDEAANRETVVAIGRALDQRASAARSSAARVLVGVAIAGGLAFYGARRVARDQAVAR